MDAMTAASVMKISLICPAFPPSGAGEAEHARQIAEHLARRGHAVDIITNAHPSPELATGFRLDATMTGWRWRDLPGLRRRLLATRPDAILLLYTAWLYGQHPMITFLPTYARRWLPQTRVMTLLEIDQEPAPPPLPVRLLRKLVARVADRGEGGISFSFGTLLRDSHALVTLGPSMRAAFARHDAGATARMRVIPPPPLVRVPASTTAEKRTAARRALGADAGTLLLAYFGYLYPGKGADTLIQALKRLADAGRPVRLVMAGGGRGVSGPSADGHARYEGEVRALASATGVAHLVSWPAGYAGGDDMVGEQLLAADIAVLPFDDGAELRRSSIAVVVSIGLPLVTTTPAVLEDVFVHEGNAMLCSPRDAVALAAAIARVADEPLLRRRLVAGSKSLARECFSWDSAIGQILDGLAPTGPGALQ